MKKMRAMVETKVYLNDKSRAMNSPVFVRVIDAPQGVSIDFNSLLDSFRVLFGCGCLVTFEVSPNNK